MKLEKAIRRERKQKKNGMQVDNKGIFIIQKEQIKRAEKIRRERLKEKYGLDKI
jgi:hypothetical protein